MTTAIRAIRANDAIIYTPACGPCGEQDCPDCGTYQLLPPADAKPAEVLAAEALAKDARQTADRYRDLLAPEGTINEAILLVEAVGLAQAAANAAERAANCLYRAHQIVTGTLSPDDIC